MDHNALVKVRQILLLQLEKTITIPQAVFDPYKAFNSRLHNHRLFLTLKSARSTTGLYNVHNVVWLLRSGHVQSIRTGTNISLYSECFLSCDAVTGRDSLKGIKTEVITLNGAEINVHVLVAYR